MQTVLSSLANTTRLQLILCLSEGEKNVTQLIGKCGLSQSAVSQHLEKLRKAGLVNTKRDGKEIYYTLIYPKTARVSEDLLHFLETVASSNSKVDRRSPSLKLRRPKEVKK